MRKSETISELRALAEALLSYRLSDFAYTDLKGGVLCPACLVMHGRIADAAYPLLCLYEETKDEKYRAAAKDFVQWTEKNCLMPDGGYRNDAGNGWEGVTAFSCIDFLKCLLYCPDALCSDEEFRTLLTKIVKRQLSMLDGFMEKVRPVVNYRAGTAYAYALAYRLFGREEYRTIAQKWEKNCRGYVTESGLLRGEGTPHDFRSARGYVPIDIAYNVEETLPSLLGFARETKDEEAKRFWENTALRHLDFMLPDGAWDDSFGSRRAKWTYYGSRTADGCATGFFDSALSPALSEAARRNTALVKKCTHGGLVTGGKMYFEAGEPTCLHHTFCRMKGFADRLKNGENPASSSLPSDGFSGIRHYPEIGVYRVGVGNMRASFVSTDVSYGSDCVGNALSLLWHAKAGVLLSCSMSDYTLLEPQNMQLSTKRDFHSNCTLRLEADGFDSVRDTAAVLSPERSSEKETVFLSRGHLQNRAKNAAGAYSLAYTVTENGLSVTAECETDARLYFPIVAAYDEEVRVEGEKARILRKEGEIYVAAQGKISLSHSENERLFNPVGGFLCVGLYAEIKKNVPFSISITVR